MWRFLPMVENKIRRGGFYIRPQDCASGSLARAHRECAPTGVLRVKWRYSSIWNVTFPPLIVVTTLP